MPEATPIPIEPVATPARPRRNKMRRTAGRPASDKVQDDEPTEDAGGLTRRSRLDGNQNEFDVPASVRARFPGWDFEYKNQTVMGQPVDSAESIRVYEGGWRPVKAKDVPELVPPGWRGKVVERGGQMLYMRPIHLTKEAQKEEYDIAEKQKADKLRAAALGDQVRGTERKITSFDIEGEVGVHRPVK